MNRSEAVDAANVITHIRPDWQQAGIIAALLQLSSDASYASAVTHAIRVAANPTNQTPGAIPAAPIATNLAQDVERQLAQERYEKRLEERRLAIAEAQHCPYCDWRGYLRNGNICTHLDPTRNQTAREKARQAFNNARKNRAPTPNQP